MTDCGHDFHDGRGKSRVGRVPGRKQKWESCVKVLRCSSEGCDQTVGDNKWAKIRAEGWVFLRDSQYCPDHKPDWYDDWVSEKLMRKLETQLSIRLWTPEYEPADEGW